MRRLLVINSSKAVFFIREFGFAQIYTAKNAHGNDFAAEIASLLKGKKTLFLRARETASSVGEILRDSSVNLTQIVAYENVFKPLEKEQKPPKNSAIIFTAPSAVRNFTRNFGWDESYKAVAIELTTAKELGNVFPLFLGVLSICYA